MTLSIASIPAEQRTTVEFVNYRMNDDEFYAFCRQNEPLKFERNPHRTIVAMPNTGGRSGNRNTKIVSQLDLWAETIGDLVFDSSMTFKLPNGATRSPDAAWVSTDRWQQLTDEEQEKFPPLAPDFVVELMSKSDSVTDSKEKMREYITNGVLLGWLVNTKQQEILIYRADDTISKHADFDQAVSGEAILPGFTFSLRLLIR